MKLGALIYISTNLWRNRSGSFIRTITLMAIGATALGVAVMILTTALVNGFQTEIQNKMFDFWGHLYIKSAESTRAVDAIPIPVDQPFYPELEETGKIPISGNDSTYGGVRHIQPVATIPGILMQESSFEGIILKGVDSTYRQINMRDYILEGEFPAVFTAGPVRDILLSEQTAEKTGLQPGDKVIILFIKDNNQVKKRFTVSGIYRTGMEEFDSRFAFIDLRVIRQVMSWQPDEVGGFEIFLDDIRDLDHFREYIYIEKLGYDLFAETVKQRFPQIFEWLTIQNINRTVILILMIIVGLINLTSALFILILERKHMIGLFTAMGIRKKDLRLIFVIQGMIITLWGLIAGNLFGLVLGWLQQKFRFIKLDEANYYLSYAPVRFDWEIIMWVNIIFFITIVLFLYLPSLIISRIDPVKVLHFR